MKKNFFLFLLSLLLISPVSWSQKVKAGQECFPEKNEEKLLYDEAGILSNNEKISIENKLDEFARTSSNQIAVVIVPDLCGMEKAQFAIELGEEWGIGQGKQDNGVVMLIKPKTEGEKGKIFIAIGRGLEGAIPDAKTYLIVDNEMLPLFRENRMYDGIDAGLDIIISLARGEYNINTYEEDRGKSGGPHFSWIILFVILFFGIIIAIRAGQARDYSRRNNVAFWTAWALLNAARNKHRGYWSDFNRGGGGFGGFGGFGGGGSSGGSSGGGFGGFGGGSFGGGGAGGEW